MTKVKGDKWKNPEYVWKFYCPFCKKFIIRRDWNVWNAIYRHLAIYHKEEFKIEKVKEMEYPRPKLEGDTLKEFDSQYLSEVKKAIDNIRRRGNFGEDGKIILDFIRNIMILYSRAYPEIIVSEITSACFLENSIYDLSVFIGGSDNRLYFKIDKLAITYRRSYILADKLGLERIVSKTIDFINDLLSKHKR